MRRDWRYYIIAIIFVLTFALAVLDIIWRVIALGVSILW